MSAFVQSASFDRDPVTSGLTRHNGHPGMYQMCRLESLFGFIVLLAMRSIGRRRTSAPKIVQRVSLNHMNDHDSEINHWTTTLTGITELSV
jgi:hypothetical protein